MKNAEEIRARAEEASKDAYREKNDNYHSDMGDVILFLGEIAAQLAELNQNLKADLKG